MNKYILPNIEYSSSQNEYYADTFIFMHLHTRMYIRIYAFTHICIATAIATAAVVTNVTSVLH